MDDEGYKSWRRRWLRWHARCLLANALALSESARSAYLQEMHSAYGTFGDFTEDEVVFVFRRVFRAFSRLPPFLSVLEEAQWPHKRIREEGMRLMKEAAALNADALRS